MNTASDFMSTTVDHLPSQLYLEVTNRCNLRCRTCPQSWGIPESSADLTARTIQQLVNQLPRLDRVVLHGIGEPILNTELPEIVRLLKAKEAYVLMNSNGTMLTRARAEPIIAAGMDEIRISLDAATPETYQYVRAANFFKKIMANITEVHAIKRELASATPKLSLWMTGLIDTLKDLPELVRLAYEVDIQEVYLQRLVTSGRGLARKDESLYGVDVESLDSFADAEKISKELGITLQGSGNTTGVDSVRSDSDEEAPWRRCTRPWTMMYITANGNALPCCIAPFTNTPHSSLILGNVFEDTIPPIWNGHRYRQWRGAMLQGKPPPPCAGCGKSWSL